MPDLTAAVWAVASQFLAALLRRPLELKEDYYAVLPVQPDAEPEVIEAAYRQLMRKYHPNVAGSDRERAAILHECAKGINRAYAVLPDPRQRWIYDRLPPGGAAAPHHRPRGPRLRPPKPTGRRRR